MKVDFSKKFYNFNGDVLTDSNTQKELTLGEVCVESLLSVDKTKPIDGREKVKRFSLASAIYKGEKESLTAEEIVIIKELIGSLYTTMIAGQAIPMLDSE